ncbi:MULTISPECIES: M20 family metallopeptidase [Haloferax]|uniref:M20/M25/M40 family metallo-hydrolase n=1 Tax=Haloferax marinum TaxID=2666143 RepID=A0A6A8G3D1_9EURY|nr:MULTISPECIES: M20 family metallopeptidase [Haloferax]KAB1196677.1 M20 family metallopeptidase [Haloferax sp. CBA1150]MRW95684.1 M20/M25/M40 family metallo-hydrolase [Haloferax marinum]
MTGDGFDPVSFLERAVPVASNEDVGAMRDLLVETLEANGADPTVDDAGNTVASKGASDPETHLVLNTHIDTVSPHIPYSREDGTIHGRGSCDAKGPLAALLAAFFSADPASDSRVTLAITPDEELLSTGAAALDVDGDLYIVGEPTGLDVCTAAKGRFEGTVTLGGVAAHAAEPDSGSNAIDALAPVLDALRSFDDDRPAHPELGPATLTPTMVDGGENSNQVPAECRLVVDRRSVPPETADGFRSSLLETLESVVPEGIDVGFELTERPTPFLEAFATDPDHDLVTTLADASQRVGGRGDVRPFTAATEASYFSPAPVVVFGPGVLADDEGAVAHADREYVHTDDVRTAAEALVQTVDHLVS